MGVAGEHIGFSKNHAIRSARETWHDVEELDVNGDFADAEENDDDDGSCSDEGLLVAEEDAVDLASSELVQRGSEMLCKSVVQETIGSVRHHNTAFNAVAPSLSLSAPPILHQQSNNDLIDKHFKGMPAEVEDPMVVLALTGGGSSALNEAQPHCSSFAVLEPPVEVDCSSPPSLISTRSPKELQGKQVLDESIEGNKDACEERTTLYRQEENAYVVKSGVVHDRLTRSLTDLQDMDVSND
ncbi:hypothetical protein LTR16_002247 [Cryomyces antarcticus]|uniref:Uncharacterized protein n=1 Tax=Cryomyces antarcticus TaxID=329879 RepID=A0ABR0KTH1_9PEZI|nr:hypothetical protein LTR60_002636 [Cryomyces antarcticus]KAK5017838.1 hypothetical protein LTR39_001319 [Cryomyces antarcticus]KAK5129312.1 hypothetical protein LTR16_002247 [Cryomyces antarcticus]